MASSPTHIGAECGEESCWEETKNGGKNENSKLFNELAGSISSKSSRMKFEFFSNIYSISGWTACVFPISWRSRVCATKRWKKYGKKSPLFTHRNKKNITFFMFIALLLPFLALLSILTYFVFSFRCRRTFRVSVSVYLSLSSWRFVFSVRFALTNTSALLIPEKSSN